MMLKKALLISVLSGLTLLSVGCGHLVYADGPYQGRVIDAETKQPIEGAAVLAVWWKREPGIGHYTSSVYDAQETLTDQEGNFTIPGVVGRPLNPLAVIREPKFTVFKPEYEAYGGWGINPMVIPYLPGTIRVYEEAGRTVVELRRLTTREERVRNLDRLDLSYRIPKEKYPNLIRLRNIDEVSLGLSPTHIPKEERQ